MKSWIHEISESYVSGHKPVRRDLKENYASLTEDQQFGLLSENVLSYLDEQLQNAYGFGVSDLNEEELNTIFANLLESKEESTSPETPTPETPETPETPTPKTPTPETKSVRISGTSHEVPEGHIVIALKGGGVITGPPNHVLAAAGPTPIIRIHDPWNVHNK